uniref:Uncharacterized protein n=1 Tax=Oryza meridionalis TaxID=40149 RepID=A0A0E0D2E9_9ORYZ
MDVVTGPSAPSAARRQSQQFSTVTAGEDDSPALNSKAKTHLKDLTHSVSRYPRKNEISVDPR